MKLSLILLPLLLVPALLARPAAAISQQKAVALLKEIDARSSHSVDYKVRVYIERKAKGKDDIVLDAEIYRRDAKDAIVILFVAPKSERGTGYLRIDRNLWSYDPRTGKWARRTERERIGGTGSNRKDFDKSELAKHYTPRFIREGKLGRYRVLELELKAKKGGTATYAKMRIFVSKEQKTVLKAQEYAASGKLLRTLYYPKWVHAKLKGVTKCYPKQIRIYDEIAGDRTTVVVRNPEVRPIPANIFTKAWLESKSR